MYGIDCMSRSSVSTKTMLGRGPGVGVDVGVGDGPDDPPQACASRAMNASRGPLAPIENG
jgi:hypothetical protein